MIRVCGPHSSTLPSRTLCRHGFDLSSGETRPTAVGQSPFRGARVSRHLFVPAFLLLREHLVIRAVACFLDAAQPKNVTCGSRLFFAQRTASASSIVGTYMIFEHGCSGCSPFLVCNVVTVSEPLEEFSAGTNTALAIGPSEHSRDSRQ